MRDLEPGKTVLASFTNKDTGYELEVCYGNVIYQPWDKQYGHLTDYQYRYVLNKFLREHPDYRRPSEEEAARASALYDDQYDKREAIMGAVEEEPSGSQEDDTEAGDNMDAPEDLPAADDDSSEVNGSDPDSASEADAAQPDNTGGADVSDDTAEEAEPESEDQEAAPEELKPEAQEERSADNPRTDAGQEKVSDGRLSADEDGADDEASDAPAAKKSPAKEKRGKKNNCGVIRRYERKLKGLFALSFALAVLLAASLTLNCYEYKQKPLRAVRLRNDVAAGTIIKSSDLEEGDITREGFRALGGAILTHYRCYVLQYVYQPVAYKRRSVESFFAKQR